MDGPECLAIASGGRYSQHYTSNHSGTIPTRPSASPRGVVTTFSTTQLLSYFENTEHQNSQFHLFMAQGDNIEMGEPQNARGRCRALTKAGQPCSARATDCGYCNIHSRPGRATELGRLGGRRNRHTVGSDTSRECHPPPRVPPKSRIFSQRRLRASAAVDWTLESEMPSLTWRRHY